MPLKSLDLFVCLKLAVSDEDTWTYAGLGEEVGLSASEANQAVKRALTAGLLAPSANPDAKPGPMTSALLEFIQHGVRYAYYEAPGRLQRGMPTAHSALPLSAAMSGDASPPVVWPDPAGDTRGQAVAPLYRTVPEAARRDPALYEVLALVDAIRIGRPRERKLAFELLEKRLMNSHVG